MDNRALMNITDAIVLMLLGAFLVSFVYASMSELEETITVRNTKFRMEEVGGSIAHDLVEAYLSGKNIDAPYVEVTTEVQIPSEINGYLYKVTLTKESVDVYCPRLDYLARKYFAIDGSITHASLL